MISEGLDSLGNSKMPEGPECRITTEELNHLMVGKTIEDWVFFGGRYTDTPPEGYACFDCALPLVVESVECKGKFIYFTLRDTDGKAQYILHSLMMTGRWQTEWDKYCKWYLQFDTNETVWFRDPRALGTLRFTDSREVLDRAINRLGPDLLGSELTVDKLKELCMKYPNRNITSFLMDQQVMSGCGNYLKSEILYDARISPFRKVHSLSEDDRMRLLQALRTIPRLSYNSRGMTLRDYQNPNGDAGKFQFSLKVYGRKNMRRTRTADGRTTYWDDNVQH